MNHFRLNVLARVWQILERVLQRLWLLERDFTKPGGQVCRLKWLLLGSLLSKMAQSLLLLLHSALGSPRLPSAQWDLIGRAELLQKRRPPSPSATFCSPGRKFMGEISQIENGIPSRASATCFASFSARSSLEANACSRRQMARRRGGLIK